MQQIWSTLFSDSRLSTHFLILAIQHVKTLLQPSPKILPWGLGLTLSSFGKVYRLSKKNQNSSTVPIPTADTCTSVSQWNFCGCLHLQCKKTTIKCQKNSFSTTSLVFCASIPDISAIQSSPPRRRMLIAFLEDFCLGRLQAHSHHLKAASHRFHFHHHPQTPHNYPPVSSTKKTIKFETQSCITHVSKTYLTTVTR